MKHKLHKYSLVEAKKQSKHISIALFHINLTQSGAKKQGREPVEQTTRGTRARVHIILRARNNHTEQD